MDYSESAEMQDGEGESHTDDSKITLLIAEDQAITRLGLKMVLNKISAFEIVGEADNGQVAVVQAQRLNPAVVVMDISMPVLNGIEATQSIKTLMPDVKVIILTSRDEDDAIFAALGAGADGYCLKDASPEVLESAIRACSLGASWLDPAIAKRVLQASTVNPPKQLASSKVKAEKFALSEREREVLQLVVEGMSNQQIADKLFITTFTVKTHMRHIMEKLMVSDRTQAAVKALKDGLVQESGSNIG